MEYAETNRITSAAREDARVCEPWFPGRFFLVLILAGLGFTCNSIAASPLRLDDTRLNWSFLVLKGGMGPVSVSADVRLLRVPEAELARALLEPSEGGKPVSADGEALLIDFHSNSLGKDLRTRLWFRPGDAAALQRGRIDLTPRNERYRLYRYTRTGLYVVRRWPLPGEDLKAPDAWGSVTHSFVAYPEEISGDTVLSDPAILLYLASVASFQAHGDEVQFRAYFDEKLLLVTVRYEGDEVVTVDLQADGPDGKRGIKGKRNAMVLGISSRLSGGGGGDTGLKIAGLGGKLRILVDRELRIPLELRGRVRLAGNVSLRTKKATLGHGH
ncbi:MAG TPA: hypothetical protein ENK29_01710 [Chromatiales bacterium]|nr:hypothetical protein [Chromatiales bacterium]